MTPLEAALRYARFGWPVLPLHTPRDDGSCDCHQPDAADPLKHPIGKHPRIRNGLDGASTDQERITRWWSMWPDANVGVALAPAGLVDIAPDSVEWFAEFTARGLPETLRFASGGGNGHEHWLYARSADCPIYRLTESGKYDVLSDGYAVMPPSRGRVQSYTWLWPDSFEQLTTAPTQAQPVWALGMLNVKQRPPRQERTASSGEPPVVLDGDALERWQGRLFDLNPETGQIDRSYSLWSLAVCLLERGLAPRFVEMLLAERDASLGWEKFTHRADADARYGVIVEQAVAGQGSQRIHLNGTATRARAKAKSPPTTLEFLTVHEFNQRVEAEIAWTVVGWIGDGLLTELDGKAKRSGKTTLLLALCSAVLHGKSFLGQETRRTPIVYLTEQSGPSFKRSLRRSGIEDDDDFTLLLWGDTKGWTWDQLIPEVLAKCEEVGAHLLVIDTLAQFSGVRGDDENRSGAALEVMEPLQEATTRPLGILISRHDRKAGGAAGDSARGSSAFAGAVDIILHLERPEPKPGTERQRVIEGLGRFEETPDNVLIELNDIEPQTYRLMGDVDEIRTRDMREEMLAATPTDVDDAIHRDALFERVAGREIDKARVLRDLLREGLLGVVKKTEEGRQRARDYFYQRVVSDDDD